MVTFTGVSKTNSDYQYDFEGLSTDEKPTLADNPNMKNGSSFFELDTKKIYFWDATNETWV